MPDRILRATAKEAGLRFIVSDLTDTAAEIGNYHEAEAWTLGRLADSLHASYFIASSLKHAGTVSLRAEYSGDLSYIQADTTPMGLMRGMIPGNEAAKAGDFELVLSPCFLRVRKFNEKAKLLSEGIVEMESLEMGRSLATYCLQSEQIRSAAGILSRADLDAPDHLNFSLGFYIEALPGVEEKHLTIMEEIVKNLGDLAVYAHPDGSGVMDLLDHISGPFGFEIHKEISPEAYCPCDREGSRRGLAALGAKELQNLSREGDTAIVNCPFCRTEYRWEKDEIDTLIRELEKKETGDD